MEDFSEDAFVKIVSVSGNYHYGYIKQLLERGNHLVICLHDEGDSAIEYEAAAGGMVPDWDEELTNTEKEIVSGLSIGFTTNDLADKLSLTPATVRVHIRLLRLKLGLDNRQQLIAFASGINKRLKKEE